MESRNWRAPNHNWNYHNLRLKFLEFLIINLTNEPFHHIL